MNNDQILKWVSFGMSFFAVPAFVWTWNTHEKLVVMELKIEHHSKELSELENVNTDIQLIQRDIQGINEKLDILIKALE